MHLLTHVSSPSTHRLIWAHARATQYNLNLPFGLEVGFNNNISHAESKLAVTFCTSKKDAS